ncbi:serine hydrolase domain-containing protein [Stenotrophomonas panacihumi]|uniref:serine hydrolase domain-containing protein n=1 Tax=Stenotrophomonas panacihumi TaxID=676599 RepID=UPI0009D708E8|nr:serine hydrolase domain-containing protein [Stenotrophomonas panacihumi]PTN54849.1 hypothetical protein C9J98_09150 [Stenotrophomonas panacihumi]
MATPELFGGLMIVGTGSSATWIYADDAAKARRGRSQAAASLTKPLVAAEIARMVARGDVALDQPISAALPDVEMDDKVFGRVTIRRLLQHTAGFDQGVSGEPLLQVSGAERCPAAARAVLARPLDFAPGARVVYSNAGYCLLGEVIKRHDPGLTPGLRQALGARFGAAGGWHSPLDQLYEALSKTLPVPDLPPEAKLPDGSYYGFAWRRWPEGADMPPWTHFGRLPGTFSVALTDGRSHLLVAHFRGDPLDYNETGKAFSRKAWRCLADWRGDADHSAAPGRG